MPNIGDKVHVKPAPDLRVLYAPGRFLPAEGMELIWTPFLAERLRTGEVAVEPVVELELVEGDIATDPSLPKLEEGPIPPGVTAEPISAPKAKE